MDANLKHKIVRITITAVIFLFFSLVFFPFITPIIMAAIFAFALDPFVSRYGLRASKRRAPTLIILSLFITFISLPIVFVSLRLIDKIRGLSIQSWQNAPIYKTVEQLVARGLDLAHRMGMNISEEELSNPSGLISTAGTWLVGTTTAIAAQAPEFVLALFIFSCALFYFLTDSKAIRKAMERLDLLTKEELKQIVEVVQRTSYVTLVSTALIGVLQAGIVAIGGWICGFNEVLIIFIVTFVVSLVPVIGAAPVAFVMSGLSFLSSDVSSGIIMLVVGAIAGTSDNIIRPLILSSEEEELNPVVSLIAIIGAIIMYGFPGLLLGPVLTRLAMKIVPILFTTDPAGTPELKKS